VTDFLGGRTRTSSLWDQVRHLDGQVMGLPIPADFFETVEWIGLLKSVLTARGSYVAMELGAGYGPWIVAGANAARLRAIKDIRLCGVEADPGRFDLMRQHLMDNGLDPNRHSLHRAGVGVNAGHARWPRIFDPANAAGARPIRQDSGRADVGDTAYMAGLQDFVDIQILPFGDLLAEQPLWDLVHIDVQGWEYDLCRAYIDTLTQRARWVIIGTHSRKLDGDLLDLFHRAEWHLEHEKPTMFTFDPARKSLESMATIDGAQVWRNPKLV